MSMKKILYTSMLTTALLLSMITSASAMKGDGGSREEGEQTNEPQSYSSTIVTIPAQLADGTYTGAATVEPDDDDGFNFYPITVAVKVADGTIENLAVTGASGSNAQYSKRAETGISQALAGKPAGEYEVDAISMATCSSKAIVQAINAAVRSTPSDTSLGLGEAIYDIKGTVFTVTVSAPARNVDYSDIRISYAVGKFADDLHLGTDYTVEFLSQNEEQIVYQVTILPDGSFTIDDDGLTHSGSYNNLGQNLDILVAGKSAGRVIITSGATLALNNNHLIISGGNGETLEKYIESISNITVASTNASGEVSSTSYTTRWQHDIEPEYTGADFFNSDGSINFDIAPFANGASGRYVITINCEGYNEVTAEIGAANSAKFLDDDGTGNWAWASNYIYVCANSGIINGFADGTYQINKSLTRSQAAKMISEAFALDNGSTEVNLSDISGHWAEEYLRLCDSNGVINGYADGTMRPDQTITRAEFAKMIVEVSQMTAGGGNTGFSDISGHWAARYIEIAASNGIIGGYVDNTFRPDQPLSRGEAAKIIAIAAGLAE